MVIVEDITNYQLTLPFSKGLIADYGVQLIPEQYSPDLVNIRIQNQTSVPRNGFSRVASSEDGTYIRGLVANQRLFTVFDSIFWEIDIVNGTFINRGALSGDYDVNFVTYGDYILLLTGVNFGYRFNVSTNSFASLVAGDYTQTPALPDINANPKFGMSFAYLTMVAGSGANKNNLYISEGITGQAPDNCYKFTSDCRNMQGEILGCASTLNRAFVRTDKKISYFDKNSLSQQGNYLTFTDSPLAEGRAPASQRSIVVVDDTVFRLSKNKHIKSMGYRPGITEAEVDEMSNRIGESVQAFLDALDDDQSKSFGIYNRASQTIEWHVKTPGEPYNNSTIVYDIINDTFLPDNNKYFSCGVEFNDNHYTGSMVNSIIYLDDVGHDDDGLPVAWRRSTPLLSLGDPTQRKQMRVVGLAGEKNKLANINMQVFVDNSSYFFGTITGSDTGLAGIAADPIASLPIAGSSVTNPRVPFQQVISRSNLRAKGKNVQIVFSGGSLGEDLCLAALSIGFRGLGDTPVRDKF